MTPATKRRKRRRAKAKLKNGKSVRRHAKKTGRTGSVWEKKIHGGGSRYIHIYANAPFSLRIDWKLPK